MYNLRHDNGKLVPVKIDEKLAKLLLKAKKNVLEKNLSFFMVIDGESGCGKSTSMIQFAKFLDPTFNINKICWTIPQLKGALLNAKKGDAICMDESMILNSRSALSKPNKELMVLMSQIRSKNIFILMAINSIFNLDSNLSLFRLDVLLHLYKKGAKSDGQRIFKIYGKKKMKKLFIDGRKYYSYKTAHHFLAKPGKFQFLIDEDEYERRKQSSIKEIAGVTDSDGADDLGRVEKKYKLMCVKSLLINKYLNKMPYKDIGMLMDTPPNSLSTLLQEYKDDQQYEKMMVKIEEFKKQDG